MRDEQGRPIAPFDLWRTSMMASSARDPLWRAAVSAEVAAHPEKGALIEATCLRCHSPMAAVEKSVAGETLALELLHDPDDRHHQLALDGVSCATCHQIQPDNLGTPESFGGGFRILPGGRIFGPHDRPFSMPMRMHTGFTPMKGDHVTSSALCASCHTLFTHPLSDDGSISDVVFPEQTPYLEWRNSVFNDEIDDPAADARSCQDCHTPLHDVDGNVIRTRIARNPHGRDFPPIVPRQPYGMHTFLGGNTLVPAILRDNPEALGITAPPQAFDATIGVTGEQLRQRTATVTITDVERTAERPHVSRAGLESDRTQVADRAPDPTQLAASRRRVGDR